MNLGLRVMDNAAALEATVPAVCAAIAGKVALIEIAGIRIESVAIRSRQGGRGRGRAGSTAYN